MPSNEGTFGVTGIPPPEDAQYKTDLSNHIPYVTGMPLRYEIMDFLDEMWIEREDQIMQKQWTLFVKALERFKALPVNEKLSYFQVAGIHGSPEQPWDGAKKPKPTPDHEPAPGEDPFGGYCHHNTIAFPTWHRPYMLLYEQCIWLNMKLIIEEWVSSAVLSKEDSAPWIKAADTWRLPYWDWARKQRYPRDFDNFAVEPWYDFGIPYVFSVEHVPVFLPTGRDNNYPNPLWHFENPEKDSAGKPLPFGKMPEGKEQWNIPDNPVKADPKKPWEIQYPWSRCTATSRWGILYDPKTEQFNGLEGKNEWKSCNTALATAGNRMYRPRRGKEEEDRLSKHEWEKIRPRNIADAVNRMFSPDYNGEWSGFASTKWYAEKVTDIRTGYLSLEYIHNNIHNLTGGSSLGLHVGDNPNGKPSDPDPDGIYGSGQMCDVPVAAFDPIFWMHHCNIDRYTAMWQCLNWEKWFEKEPPAPPGDDSHIEDVKADTPLDPFHVKDGGNPDDKENIWTSDRARDWTKSGYQYDDLMPKWDAVDDEGKLIPEIYKSNLLAWIHELYPGTSYQAWAIREDDTIDNVAFFGPKTTEDRAYEDYLINVVYDRYALNGRSYAINFMIDGEYVGQIYSLGGMKPGTEIGCANCGNQRDARILSKGQVPISIPLMQKAADTSFTNLITFKADSIEDYLAENLSYEFVEAGSVRPASDFPNTKISVLAGKAVWSQEQRDGHDIWKPPLYVTDTYRPLYKATEHLEYGAKREASYGLSHFETEIPLDEVEVPLTFVAA